MKTTLDIKNKPMRMIILRYGIGVSLYLWIFCQHSYAATINTDPQPCGTVLIAAHRGGYENDKVDRAPENSVANILNCERKGYDLYETDIQRTKDGHFVIVHDKIIDRETTGTGACGNMNLAELKQLYKRYRDGSISDERVASLAEFLQVGKNRVVYKADLKPGVSEYFKEIMQQVVKHDALDGIIFRVPYSRADLFAQYKAEGVISSRGLLMFMVSSKAQLDDIKTRFDPLMIQIDLNKSNPATPHALELIQYATRQGLLVEIHDYGTPADWIKFLEAGARMFHTNKPSEIKGFLHNQNMNKGKSK